MPKRLVQLANSLCDFVRRLFKMPALPSNENGGMEETSQTPPKFAQFLVFIAQKYEVDISEAVRKSLETRYPGISSEELGGLVESFFELAIGIDDQSCSTLEAFKKTYTFGDDLPRTVDFVTDLLWWFHMCNLQSIMELTFNQTAGVQLVEKPLMLGEFPDVVQCMWNYLHNKLVHFVDVLSLIRDFVPDFEEPTPDVLEEECIKGLTQVLTCLKEQDDTMLWD